MKTTQIIEALLFASDAPLSADDLVRGEEELEPEDVEGAVNALRAEYEDTGRAFQIYRIAGGYQLLTRPEYSPHLERFETVPQSTRVSGPALEVLAIIAYRQPIARASIEEIRGVDSTHTLRTLQELGLIEVVGRGEGLGRPLLYGTTPHFLEHFGFTSLDDLPKPDELPVVLAEQRVEVVDAEEVEAGQAEVAEEAEKDAEAEPSDEGDPSPTPSPTPTPKEP
ncbi:MAG: SMC-Scp complex subunit ScpB [Longimicrobiales bacterium]